VGCRGGKPATNCLSYGMAFVSQDNIQSAINCGNRQVPAIIQENELHSTMTLMKNLIALHLKWEIFSA
jgi:hypothetical protein